jgi:hypothetical protein
MTASWFTELLKDASLREQPLQQWKTLPECKWHSDEPPRSEGGNTWTWILVCVSCFVVAAVCVCTIIVRRKRLGERQESAEPFAEATDWKSALQE